MALSKSYIFFGLGTSHIAQKMKFSFKDLFSKYEQIGSFFRIWSHLLKKSLMESFIFCAVLNEIYLEVVVWRWSAKHRSLKFFKFIQKHHLHCCFFIIKLLAQCLQFYLKNPCPDIFLWFLGSFSEHFFIEYLWAAASVYQILMRISYTPEAGIWGVLWRNFAKFTGKHLCQSLFFNKVAGLRPAILLKKKLWHIFSCEFCEISKNTLFTEHLRWLLLILWLSCHHLSAFAFNFELVHTWFLCLIPGGIIFLDLIEWKGDV